GDVRCAPRGSRPRSPPPARCGRARGRGSAPPGGPPHGGSSGDPHDSGGGGGEGGCADEERDGAAALVGLAVEDHQEPDEATGDHRRPLLTRRGSRHRAPAGTPLLLTSSWRRSPAARSRRMHSSARASCSTPASWAATPASTKSTMRRSVVTL